jgi:hypothetical protein
VGCLPCADGYYASPSNDTRSCQPCPIGFYAKKTNYSDCTYYAQTEVAWELSGSTASCEAGAVVCTPCPPHANYTHHAGSTSIADCKQCALGEYETPTGCAPCAPKCRATEYEAQACTQHKNRFCRTCYNTECGIGGCCIIPLGNVFYLLRLGIDYTGLPQERSLHPVQLRPKIPPGDANRATAPCFHPTAHTSVHTTVCTVSGNVIPGTFPAERRRACLP